MSILTPTHLGFRIVGGDTKVFQYERGQEYPDPIYRVKFQQYGWNDLPREAAKLKVSNSSIHGTLDAVTGILQVRLAPFVRKIIEEEVEHQNLPNLITKEPEQDCVVSCGAYKSQR